MKKRATKIPASHQNEWESKRKFEEVIKPWYLPFGWSEKDYGIDGQVEITSPIEDGKMVEPQSQYYHVQLKSIETPSISKGFLSYSIPVVKVAQWFRSNVPVQLVLLDLNAQLFYYLWIDDELIISLDKNTPKWSTQTTITLKIPLKNSITGKSLDTIKEYVYNWKKTSRKIIQPGLYFDLVQKCKDLNIDLESINTSFNFKSVIDQVAEFDQRINSGQFIFRICKPTIHAKRH